MPRACQLLGIVALLTSAVALAADKPTDEAQAKQAAVAAADKWLAAVDSGKYDDAWTAAAALLKGAVKQEGFSGALRGVRQPLGAVKARQVKSQQYLTSLPGAPDGQYVVIQYETEFENKKSAVETVTPMLDKDGAWRVSGYFIK